MLSSLNNCSVPILAEKEDLEHSITLTSDKQRPFVAIRSSYRKNNKITDDENQRISNVQKRTTNEAANHTITDNRDLINDGLSDLMKASSSLIHNCNNVNDTKTDSDDNTASRKLEEKAVSDLKVEEYATKAVTEESKNNLQDSAFDIFGGPYLKDDSIIEIQREKKDTDPTTDPGTSTKVQQNKAHCCLNTMNGKVAPPADADATISPTSNRFTEGNSCESNLISPDHDSVSKTEAWHTKKASSWPSSLRKLLAASTEATNKKLSKGGSILSLIPTTSENTIVSKASQKPDNKTNGLFALLTRKSSFKEVIKANTLAKNSSPIHTVARTPSTPWDKTSSQLKSTKQSDDCSTLTVFDPASNSNNVHISSSCSYPRLPIQLERAIYHLSHIKLSNPRRPLRDQVVISNLMFWYLSVFAQPLQIATDTKASIANSKGTSQQNSIPIISFMRKALPMQLMPGQEHQPYLMKQQQASANSNAMELLNLHERRKRTINSNKIRGGSNKKGNRKVSTAITTPHYSEKIFQGKCLKASVCYSSDDDEDEDEDEDDDGEERYDNTTRTSSFITLAELEASNKFERQKKHSKMKLMKHGFLKLKPTSKKPKNKEERRISSKDVSARLQATATTNFEMRKQKADTIFKSDEDDIPLAMYKRDRPF